MRGKNNTTSMVWTDEEVGLLLQVVLDYKTDKQTREKRDWETVASKYADIWHDFLQELSQKETCDDFPRTKGEVTKMQLTAKIKNIRGKYRQAVETGKRNGNGRVVLLFYEVCERIWGGSLGALSAPGLPQIHALEAGLETEDLNAKRCGFKQEEVAKDEEEDVREVASSSTCTERAPVSPVTSSERVPSTSAFSGTRTNTRIQFNGYTKSARLKRKFPLDVAQQDLELKQQMFHMFKLHCQRADERMDRLMDSVDKLVHVISQSHAQLLAQTRCTCRGRPPLDEQGYSGLSEHSEHSDDSEQAVMAVKEEPEEPPL